MIAQAQSDSSPNHDLPTATIDDVPDADVFAANKNLVIAGTVQKGVLVFGGDVKINGRVEGDVATFGGSIEQTPDSFIGGDVIVIGGGYHHGKTAPNRNPTSQTVIFAGYEEELRAFAQNPALLIAPDFSAVYLAQRVLTVLFWFVVSLIVTTFAPGAIGRAIARLKLSNLRIAVFGSLAMFAATLGVALALRFLPSVLSAAFGVMMLLLLFLVYLFGRVVVHAATGKWLQKMMRPNRKHSESNALLFGAVVWTLLLSIPFIWSAVFVGLFIVSLGLVLTARPKFAR